MFRLRLFDNIQHEELNVVCFIAIRCIDCNKEAGLYLINTTIEEIITKFVLNAILNHVGVSWIICFKKEIFYEMTELKIPIG